MSVKGSIGGVDFFAVTAVIVVLESMLCNRRAVYTARCRDAAVTWEEFTSIYHDIHLHIQIDRNRYTYI